VYEFIDTPADAWITIEPAYNSASRAISIDVNTKILLDIPDSLQLVIYLTEDSIVKPQADYSLPEPAQYITDYVHRHVFRGSANGTWGSPLSVGSSFNAGQEFDSQFNYTLPSEWVAENMHLVAVLFKASSKEVIQAEEIHLIE
jgi:hypothetical protein